MVQLRTQRTSLILYGVLLVLPTLVLGGLQWRQLLRDYDEDRLSVPHDADDAAMRFREAIADRLGRLVESEALRPFMAYGDMVIASDEHLGEATPLSSPLVEGERPDAILAWFAFDLREDPIDLWGGAGASEPALLAAYEPTLRLLRTRYNEERATRRLMMRWEKPRGLDIALQQVVFNRLHKRELDCLQFQQVELARLKVSLEITPFHLQFYIDPDGTPRMLATRRVILYGPVTELDRFGECFELLSGGMDLVQGFLIDTEWFFEDLPARIAKSVLDSSQRYVAFGDPPCCGGTEYHAEIELIADLGIETHDPSEAHFMPMRVAVDTAAIDARNTDLQLRFLGLAAMLAISLGTGMWLLLRSVRRDLEQATRTENFVAAVTHELRTPLTSIKMYGEMLLDGEATRDETRQEYYKRIVRATERLSTLVERVLEKSRLAAGGARPEAADLNELATNLSRQLVQYGPEGDLKFELAPDLPLVLTTTEAVNSIVSNLVENARKYAPVDPTRPGFEPIVVRTLRRDDEVVLEVLDRGPGVAEDEREKIFEAFYRVGNEATRTARGAGLGLHLVLLQARSIGGEAGHRPREGGGSIFWVSFATADASPEPGGQSGTSAAA